MAVGDSGVGDGGPRSACATMLVYGRVVDGAQWGSVQSERGVVARFWERESHVHIRSWRLVLVGWEWHVFTARMGATHLLRDAHAGDMDTTHQWQHIRSPSCKRVRQHSPAQTFNMQCWLYCLQPLGAMEPSVVYASDRSSGMDAYPSCNYKEQTRPIFETDSRAQPLARL